MLRRDRLLRRQCPYREIADSREFLDLQAALAGRYTLEHELGRGGMGIVFLARDAGLDRPVAIKLLPPYLAVQADIRQRFLQEARLVARLSHPNIVTVFAVEEHQDLVFFVMAYVRGETLAQRVGRAGPLPPATATRLIQEVAWGLGYAHANGVIHRDVKLDNVLIDQASGRADSMPAERMLEAGAVQLFNELPAALRDRFENLPEVEDDLCCRAEELRGETGSQDELSRVIGALERVRLDLMRLKAGEGSADQLGAALDAAVRLNRATGARRVQQN